MKEYQLVGNDTAPTVQIVKKTKTEVKLICSDGRKMTVQMVNFKNNFEEIDTELEKEAGTSE